MMPIVSAGSTTYARSVAANLKERVYRALRVLAQGFFDRRENGLDPNQDSQRKLVHDNCMRFLYRLLFVLYAEGKGLLSEPAYLKSNFSLFQLKREVADRKDRGDVIPTAGSSYWARLKDLFELVDAGSEAVGIRKAQFFVPPYNGGLFDGKRNAFLNGKALGDKAVADAMDLLARAPVQANKLGFVDYSTLEIRHLGSIYEGLLEYQIRIAEDRMVATGEKLLWVSYDEYQKGRKKPSAFDDFSADDRAEKGQIYLGTHRGERKATGSYYTPEPIVQYIVSRALTPILSRIRKRDSTAQRTLRDAILGIRVLDPAMGSGHFLVGVVEFLAPKLVEAVQMDLHEGRLTEAESQKYTIDFAKREIAAHCIYGVDLNELAVELAKVSIWLATISREKPLSFLDHHLCSGNSLVGARIVDLAWLPGERPKGVVGQLDKPLGLLEKILQRISALGGISDDSVQDVKKKESLFVQLRESDEYQRIRTLADLHAGLDFTDHEHEAVRNSYMEIVNEAYYGNPEKWRSKVKIPWAQDVKAVSDRKHFLHWELEFPEIYFEGGQPKKNPGFSAVVGNPPYVNALDIARSGDPRERDFIKTHFASAKGAFDLFIPFLELGIRLVEPEGRSGLITPNKFLSAPYAVALREFLGAKASLVSVLDASKGGVFEDPAVYPIVTVVEKKPPAGGAPILVEDWDPATGMATTRGVFPQEMLGQFPENLWSFLLSRNSKLIEDLAKTCVRLDSIAQVQASTTAAEADEFARFLVDCPGGNAHSSHFAVLNTGLIDSYESLWGFEPLTHQGRVYKKPCVLRKEPGLSGMRKNLYSSAKLIVAKVALRPEVCIDFDGSVAAANVNFVFAPKIDVWCILGILNSRLMNLVYREYFGALTMQGSYAQFQAPQIRVLPVPKDLERETPPAPSERGAVENLLDGAIQSASRDKLVASVAAARLVRDLERFLKSPRGRMLCIGILARRLVEWHTEKRRLMKEFLEWFASPAGLGVPLHSLRNASKIERFYETSAAKAEPGLSAIQNVLAQNKITLSAGQLGALSREFSALVDQLFPVLWQVELGSRAADDLVDILYGTSTSAPA